MEIFAVGDRVSHFIFGAGKVVAVDGQDRVSVKFDDGQTKWLMVQHAKLQRLNVGDAYHFAGTERYTEDVFEQNEESQANDIFVFEQSEENHSMGSHWSPFFEDFSKQVLVHLPTMLKEAGLAVGVASFGVYKPPALPANWPTAFKLRWPQREDAIHFVTETTEQSNEIKTFFPVISRGTQETLEISKIYIWKGGVEAQVEANIAAAEITFFDTDFVISAGWYQKRITAEFILVGLAYECELANEPDMILPDDHPLMESQRKMAEIEGKDIENMPNKVSFKGMAVLLPIPEWDRDDYQFRGTIKDMRPYSMLEQDGWLLTVCVMRDLDEKGRELNLNILVTNRVWQEKAPPQVGDDVRGTLWLQGRLWMPPPHS